MIKQLQRRFIGVSMLSAALMMLLLLGVVNGLRHYGMVAIFDYTLSTIVAYDDVPLQQTPEHPSYPAAPDGLALRSFSVTFDETNQAIAVNRKEHMEITEAEAISFATDAVAKGKTRGVTKQYRYLIHPLETGVKVVLVDCSLEREMMNRFLIMSAVVWVVALIVVFGFLKLMMKPAIRPVVESYEKQKRFITDAGHELKTPLAILSADAEVLELENGENEWTKSIHAQVNRLRMLTEELVTLSRMEEDSVHMSNSPQSLSDIVNDVVAGFEPTFAMKNRMLETHIEEDVVVSGDHDSLEKLVSILLDNAIKYATGVGAVSVQLWQIGKRISFTVSNPATGMEAGRHDELFDRFYRADPSRNRETGGYGIGLAIARSAVERHKGNIHADCDDGIFTVTVEI